MTASLKAQVYEIYQAFSAGRLDQLADMFDENVEFSSNAPHALFPYLGSRTGRADVMKALEAVHQEFQEVSFMPVWIVAEDDTAAMLVSARATRRATGHVIHFFAAHFMQFRDGRIAVYRAIMDASEAVQQILERELDFGRA